MKKATKLVSGVLAALMATSAFTATGFAAAKTPTKEDCDAAESRRFTSSSRLTAHGATTMP